MAGVGDVCISVIGPHEMLSEHNTPEEDDCWTATIQGTIIYVVWRSRPERDALVQS